jgi:hypothetical protein
MKYTIERIERSTWVVRELFGRYEQEFDDYAEAAKHCNEKHWDEIDCLYEYIKELQGNTSAGDMK